MPSHLIRERLELSSLFQAIASDLHHKGYFIQKNALPKHVSGALLRTFEQHKIALRPAGVGRGSERDTNQSIRRDSIVWLEESVEDASAWHEWVQCLKEHLNQHLLLGLFSFESHFALYKPGDFYRKHLDAFRGQTNRKLSVLTYLNPTWCESDGGELIVYSPSSDAEIARVSPEFGTLAIFLSEEFPHEVMPSERERVSVAGWFHISYGNNPL